jgi:hypothetical protein
MERPYGIGHVRGLRGTGWGPNEPTDDRSGQTGILSRLFGFLEDGLGARITKQIRHRNYYLCYWPEVTPDIVTDLSSAKSRPTDLTVTAELPTRGIGDRRDHGFGLERTKFRMAGRRLFAPEMRSSLGCSAAIGLPRSTFSESTS